MLFLSYIYTYMNNVAVFNLGVIVSSCPLTHFTAVQRTLYVKRPVSRDKPQVMCEHRTCCLVLEACHFRTASRVDSGSYADRTPRHAAARHGAAAKTDYLNRLV